MLIALNREAELKMHLRASFNNGVTRDELKELIMHSALYWAPGGQCHDASGAAGV